MGPFGCAMAFLSRRPWTEQEARATRTASRSALLRTRRRPRSRTRSPVRARRGVSRPADPGHLTLAETARDVVIDHADGLHVRVDDGGTDQPEATAFQVLAEGVGLLALRRDVLDRSGTILLRSPVDKTPLIGGETPELVPHAQEGPGVLDRRFDLEPVANDARVSEELLHLAGIEARDALGIEAGKGPPVGFPLPQDRDPAQAGLGTFEEQELEQSVVVVNRDTPLLVVVADVEGVRSAPPTASHRARHGRQHRARRGRPPSAARFGVPRGSGRHETTAVPAA